ncbi:MAG: hypothetical protein K1X83_12825 [Oligoflexia bacterium]|nr:hypothetical protein [Oligoflexia bacterium]
MPLFDRSASSPVKPGNESRPAIPTAALDTLRADISGLTELILGQLGVSPYEVQSPLIELDPDHLHSQYNLITNTITINGVGFGRGAVYGEEILHWLRHQLQPRLMFPLEHEAAVSEFFGWLGRTVAKECAHGSALQHLFEPAPKPQPPTLGTFVELLFERKQLNIAFQQQQETRIGTAQQDLQPGIEAAQRLSELGGTPALVEVNLATLRNESAALLRVVRESVRGCKQLLPEIVAQFACEHLDKVAASLRSGDTLPDYYLISDMANSVAGMLNGVLIPRLQNCRVQTSMTALLKRFELEDLEIHMIGYTAAEYHLQSNGTSQVSALLRRPSQEIYSSYIESEPVRRYADAARMAAKFELAEETNAKDPSVVQDAAKRADEFTKKLAAATASLISKLTRATQT